MQTPREKDPAAVALGRKRQASVTPAEKSAFGKLGGDASIEANRKRPPAERRAIARRAAMTRRLKPRWLYTKDSATQSTQIVPGSPGEPPDGTEPPPVPPDAGDLAALAAALDALDDEAITAMAARLNGSK